MDADHILGSCQVERGQNAHPERRGRQGFESPRGANRRGLWPVELSDHVTERVASPARMRTTVEISHPDEGHCE